MDKESTAKTLTEFKRSLAKFDSDKIDLFDSLCLLYSVLYCYKLTLFIMYRYIAVLQRKFVLIKIYVYLLHYCQLLLILPVAQKPSNIHKIKLDKKGSLL